jgi:chromosome segregation ATPase
MPLIDKLKSLFSRKGETEKKIAFLSERKTALAQQRDRAYEEIGALEQQDEALKTQFKDTSSAITRRRITTQLVQLRKDIERRQQMMQVLNQQINVVGTHLHNLELTQQGTSAKLPDSDEIATDAAAAEEMLAQLQADNELADSVGTVAHAGMSDEEQALYEELEREAGGPETTKVALDHAEPAVPDEDEPTPNRAAAEPNKRRAEPEAG